MRPLSAIGALVLLAGMAPAPSHADGPAPATEAAAPAPGCRCPGIRHVRRVHRYVRHVRHRRPIPLYAVEVPPPIYDPPIPSPYDTAYDRAMTLHFRSAVVSGSYTGEPGYPHIPAVASVQPYRGFSGATVLQYDGITGEYIALAQVDARRFLAALGPAVAPPAAAPAPPKP